MQVLHGRVRMISGAQDDSAVLLTVASGPDLMVLCRQLMRVSEAW